MKGKPFIASYSGGKDCVLAIYRALKIGMVLKGLVITYNIDRKRSWFHGIPTKTLLEVEKSISCPVNIIETTGEEYKDNFEKELLRQKSEGIETCIFGDIDLDGHLEWCTKRCNNVGLEAFFPLWNESRKSLVYEEIELGFVPIITIVDTNRLDPKYLGCILTKEIAQQIESEGADICGENGEYHTFVTDGPIFKNPISIDFGNAIQQENFAILPIIG